MAVDEKEFFREATLHICGNLDIEKAMDQFLRYLQKFMPVDRLILERYDEGLGTIKSVINVTSEGTERIDVPAPLSEVAKTVILRMYQHGVP